MKLTLIDMHPDWMHVYHGLKRGIERKLRRGIHVIYGGRGLECEASMHLDSLVTPPGRRVLRP
jgi:hypothetical protein